MDKQVEALVVLVLINGKTYQVAIPRASVQFHAKSVLVSTEALEGALIPCSWADLRPMDCEGFPFKIGESNETNKK